MQNLKFVSDDAPQSAPRLGEEVLSIRNVSRGFDKAQAELLVLDDVNLSLREGDIVGLPTCSICGRKGACRSNRC